MLYFPGGGTGQLGLPHGPFGIGGFGFGCGVTVQFGAQGNGTASASTFALTSSKALIKMIFINFLISVELDSMEELEEAELLGVDSLVMDVDIS